jgi:peptide methionine sulfoxide reductase MsrA
MRAMELLKNLDIEQLIAELTTERAYSRPIVTAVKPLKNFYPAEAYHKDYYKKHPKGNLLSGSDRPKNC